MIGMIGHLVQVSPQRGRRCLFLHLLGLVLGAAALGAVLGLVGAGLRYLDGGLTAPLTASPYLGLGLGLLALLCGLRELRVLSFPLPQSRRQVPREWWYDMGTLRASFVWGLVIGPGLFTIVEYPVYYLVLALALVSPPTGSVLLLALYGLGQGLAQLLRALPVRSQGGGAATEGLWSEWLHSLAGGGALAFAAYLFAFAWLAGHGAS